MATIDNPHELHPAWADRFNAQDLDGMLALAEPDSTFVPQPGAATTGADARGALQQFLSFGLPISMTVRHVYVNGDVALAIVDWTLQGTARDGSQIDLKGTTADVARRGTEGWTFVIDNPFGTA